VKLRLVFALLSVVLVTPAFAQVSPNNLWSGQIQCQLNVQNNGYAHQEVQTWTVTGSPTDDTKTVYPAAWSVSGQGGLQRAQSGQVLAGRWNSSVPGMNAPLRIFVRTSDGRLVIKGIHSLLVAPGATNVVKQVGASQTNVVYAAEEWILPIIEDVGTSANVSGTGTIVVAPTLMPMQPGTSGTATCKWNFTKGANRSKVVPPLGTGPPQNSGGLPAVKTPPTADSTNSVSSTNAGPAVQGAPEGTSTNTTSAPMQTTIHKPNMVARTATAKGSNSGSDTNSPTEAGHTLLAASELPDVRGDSGSDVDTRSSSWSSDGQDDFYRFSLVRSTQSLSHPPLSAMITISGLQSSADFDVMIYNLQGRSFSGGPFLKVTHTGSASFVTSISENSLGDAVSPPDLVIVLHSRTTGPYTLTVAGNRGGPGTTIPTDIQTPTYTPFSPAPLGAGMVSGNSGSDVTTKAGNWGTGNQDVFYDFGLIDGAGVNSALIAPQLKATITISGLQPGADFDATVYTTQYGSGAPYGKITHTGSDPLVFCVVAAVNIQKVNTTDIVIGLHSRAAGPYQLTVAGNTTQACTSSISLPAM
jgi:hypothetical protein